MTSMWKVGIVLNKEILGALAILGGAVTGAYLKVEHQSLSPFQIWTTASTVTLSLLFLVRIIIISERKNAIKILIVDCDPEAYLERMEKIRKRAIGDKYKRLVQIYTASGWIYLGEVERAIEILLNVSLKGFCPKDKGVYYNNLAFAYLLMNKTDQAQEVFKDHIGEMLAADREFMVQSCARCTQAILDYKQNRNDVAIETLDRLLTKDLKPLQKSVALYYKGLILSKNGNTATQEVFTESASYGGKTIFGELSAGAISF